MTQKKQQKNLESLSVNIGCAGLLAFILIMAILFAGEPDLMDAIIKRLMAQ